MQCQVFMHLRRHFVVDWSHHLVEHLHNADANSTFRQVFRHLQPDEAAADDDRSFYLLCSDISVQCVQLRDVVKDKHPIKVNTGQWRDDWLCSRGKHQLVVVFPVFPAIGILSHKYILRFPVYCHNLAVGARIDVEHSFQAFGCCNQQFFTFINGTAQVVWQSAIRKGHIGSFLEHHNLCVLIHPAQSRCCTCPSGDTANNHYFHLCLLSHVF